MTDDIVGSIQPSADGGPPVFTIIRRGDIPPAEVRPCEHPQFTLDPRWSTVTCGKCGERVEPFAALMRYAQWWEKLDQRRMLAEDRERRAYAGELRRLVRLRCLTDEERAEVEQALRDHYRRPLKELAKIVDRFSDIARERRRRRPKGLRAHG